MKNLKDWFNRHEMLSGLLIILLISGSILLIQDFCSITYEKFYPNEYTSEYARETYEIIVKEGYSQEETEYDAEYAKLYINKSEAINDFMDLATTYDVTYANGKFYHWYVRPKERVYRCWDKDRNLIAIRFLKHRRLGLNWEPVYEVRFYTEKTIED